MPSSTEDPVAHALLRLLAVSAGFEGAGLFACARPGTGAGLELRAATPSLERIGFGADALHTALLHGSFTGPRRIKTVTTGIERRFAAIAPVRRGNGPLLGCLLVADARARRLTPATAALLADAAALALPLIEAQPVGRGTGHPVLGGAIRLRSAVERLINSSVRNGGTVLMMLDLDRFRSVNEALGTAAGDALLSVTGRRLERAVGPAGRVMRLDGDRFVIVASLDRDDAPAAVQELACRLLQAVEEPVVLAGRPVATRASIGVVTGIQPETPTPSLLMQADAALRRAKVGGRNRLALHEPETAVAALETSRLELDLPGALAHGELRLFYQPYVDLSDGSVSGVEALIRWQHPARGILLPASFIPLAEATGQILPLGRWALATALATAARWPHHLGLAVNISPLQFHQPGFLAEVDAALAASGFPPERLELEITETVLMRDNPETTAQLDALIARGIRIALDDFGTGYSALAYLARLPHHRIKLDKAFVQDLANPTTAELIRAIIALARTQGVAVTAEGVERPEHLALVRGIGFTHAQGYAIGAPLPEPWALRDRVARVADVAARP